MNKEQKERAAELLRNYASAISNILYNHGGTKEEHDKDETDCLEMAELLENDEL